MANQEKTAIINIVSTLIISGVYWGWVYLAYQLEDFQTGGVNQFFGQAFLLFIVVSIVFRVLFMIIGVFINYVVTREEDDLTFKDERDQLIGLKADRNGYVVFSIGFVLAIASQAFSMEISIMFITLIFSMIIADIVNESSKIYLHRRGF